MSLVGLLVVVIVFGLLWWAVNALMQAFGMPAPIQRVVLVLFVVTVILWLVTQLGILPHGPILRLN